MENLAKTTFQLSRTCTHIRPHLASCIASTFSETILPSMTRRDAGLPLFLQDDKIGHFPHDTPQYDRRRRRFLHVVAFLTLALFTASYFQYGRWHWCSGPPPKIVTTDIGLPKEVQQAWAAHSPYFAAAEYKVPPERCELVQVCSRSGSISKYLKTIYVNLG